MRMDVDFFKDDNGKIWMYHIRDIVVKNNDTTIKVEKLTKLKQRSQEICEQIKQEMKDDLLIRDDEEFAELISKCNKLNRKVMREGLEWETAKKVSD